MKVSRAEPHTTGLKPVLGFRDLVFFYVVAVFGIRLLPAAAAAGPSIIVFIIISLAIFFIPLGLTVTDLAQRYPGEGGVYIWSKKAFGDFHGYVTAWTYWTSNLAFFPSVLLFASSQIGLIVPGFEQLGESRLFVTLFSIGTILFILGLNVVGMRISTVLNNVSGVARYASVVFIVGLGIVSWIQFGSATDLSFRNWIPSLSSIKDLVFLSTIVYLFAGLEGASLLGDEIKDASRTVPRALVTSGILISCMYLVAAFCLLLALSPDLLSDLTGMTDAVGTGAGRIGGEGFAAFAISFMALLLALQAFGSVSVWLAASARLPFVVGLDRYLPAAFGRLHPRYKTPYVALGTLVLVTIFFVILSGLGEKAEQAYNILISLEIVTFLIPYLYLFGSVIKFEVDKNYRQQVDVPGGRKNALAAGIVGFIVVAVSLVLALIPGDDVENPLTFYLTVLSSLALNLSVGIGLYLYAKWKRT